jgi:hypothetical protein
VGCLQICRTYAFEGFCPYGPRCRFVHEPSSDGSIMSSKDRGGCRGSPGKVQHQYARGAQTRSPMLAASNLPRSHFLMRSCSSSACSGASSHAPCETQSGSSSATPPPIQERQSFPAFRPGISCNHLPASGTIAHGLWRPILSSRAASLPGESCTGALMSVATPPLKPPPNLLTSPCPPPPQLLLALPSPPYQSPQLPMSLSPFRLVPPPPTTPDATAGAVHDIEVLFPQHPPRPHVGGAHGMQTLTAHRPQDLSETPPHPLNRLHQPSASIARLRLPLPSTLMGCQSHPSVASPSLASPSPLRHRAEPPQRGPARNSAQVQTTLPQILARPSGTLCTNRIAPDAQEPLHSAVTYLQQNANTFMTPELCRTAVIPAPAHPHHSGLQGTQQGGAWDREAQGTDQITAFMASMQINSANLGSCETSDFGTACLSGGTSELTPTSSLLVST